MKSVPLLFSCLAIGLIAGWASVRKDPLPDPPERPADPGRETPAAPLWRSADFLENQRRLEKAWEDPKNQPLPRILANLSDAELLAALDEGISDPEYVVQYHRHGIGLLSTMYRDYLSRDFEAGREWFHKLSPAYQAMFSSVLAEKWPEDRAAEGLEFVMANRVLFDGRASCWPIIAKNVLPASQQGADSVISLLAHMQEEGVALRFESGGMAFAPGFDFAGLLSSEKFRALQIPAMEDVALNQWQKQDREGAFAWVMEHRGAGALMPFAARSGGTSNENMKWLGGKLDEMTPEDRAGFLQVMTKGLVGLPSGLESLLEGASDPAVRQDILSRTTQVFFSGRATEVIHLIEELPDAAERIQFLENLRPASRPGAESDSGPLESKDVEYLRTKLREWNTSEDRAEAIVQRLQQS